jgi:hypothetical protein
MIRRAPAAPSNQSSGILAELWGGLRYCWSNPAPFTVIGTGFAFGCFARPYAQLLPAFARLALDTGAGGDELLTAGASIGSLSGTFIRTTPAAAERLYQRPPNTTFAQPSVATSRR